MRLTECTLCHAPVRILTIHDDTDTELHDDQIKVDPLPSLHGWVQVIDVTASIAAYTDRSPGRYRPHYETCRGSA